MKLPTALILSQTNQIYSFELPLFKICVNTSFQFWCDFDRASSL